MLKPIRRDGHGTFCSYHVFIRIENDLPLIIDDIIFNFELVAYMGGGGGGLAGISPPPKKKKFLEKYSPPPFKRVTLWQIPPLNLEKTLYSPPKSGQFFGFPPKWQFFRFPPPKKNFGCSPTYGKCIWQIPNNVLFT